MGIQQHAAHGKANRPVPSVGRLLTAHTLARRHTWFRGIKKERSRYAEKTANVNKFCNLHCDTVFPPGPPSRLHSQNKTWPTMMLSENTQATKITKN